MASNLEAELLLPEVCLGGSVCAPAQPLLASSRLSLLRGGKTSSAHRDGKGSRASCPGPDLGRAREEKHQSCSSPLGEGRSDQIRNSPRGGRPRAGWEIGGGKPCPSLPSCMSHSSFRRAFALCLQPLKLLSQCLCPACSRELSGRGYVFTGCFPAMWVPSVGMRGLKVTWGNHLLLFQSLSKESDGMR